MKKFFVFSVLFLFVFSAIFSAGEGESRDAEWPTKPITIVCGQGAGGGTDSVVRLIASQMEEVLGVPINVVNQAGAAGSIALDFVMDRPIDGYTLQANSGFNKPARALGHTDLVPWQDWYYWRVSSAVASYSVAKNSPIKSMDQLIALAKENPGEISISNSGVGSIWHEGNSIFADAAGIKLNNIAYTSGAESTLAALQHEVDVAGGGVHEHYQFIEQGDMRNLAIFWDEPIELDSGTVLKPIGDYIPSLQGETFGPEHFIAIPRSVDSEIIAKVEEAVKYAVESEKFKQYCEQNWLIPGLITGEEADKRAAYQESVTAWLFYELGVQGFSINPEELGIPKPKEFDSWWPPKEYTPVKF